MDWRSKHQAPGRRNHKTICKQQEKTWSWPNFKPRGADWGTSLFIKERPTQSERAD